MNNPTDNKRIATTTVGIICLTIAVVLCCVATFAWFDNSVGSLDFPTNFGGSSIAAYFNGGEGSKADPFQIDNPTNLYNLAWLQYLGYFNLRSGLNNGRAQTYFKLTSDIDMSEVASYLKALPPIGTSEHPFIGQFDGNNKTVSKLNVSNKRDDYGVYPTNAKFDNSGMLTTCADAADATPSQIEFVAMFGVVGDFNEWVTKSSAYTGNDNNVEFGDSRAKPALNPSPDPKKANQFFYGSMYVGSMYVDNLVVKSYTDNTLVGLAAGYVAGSLKNFGVYRSTINLAGGSKGTTLAKTIDGNGNQVAYGNTVSKFSIVGDYDTTLVGWTERPIGENDSDYWGGSVDMRTLNRRINYMTAKTGEYNNGLFLARSDDWGISAKMGSLSSETYWNPSRLTSAQIVYLYDGTVLPLNVDKDKMGLSSLSSVELTKTILVGSKNILYHLNSEYNTLSKEVIKPTNTGYIVSSGDENNSTIRTRLQALAYGSFGQGGIYKSLGYSEIQTADLVYDKTRFEMLTISKDGSIYRILDDVKTSSGTALTSDGTKQSTDFVEYNTVRKNFDRAMEGSTIVHGFHFVKALPSGSARQNVVSSTETKILSRNDVLIDRKYYTTGDLPEEYSECEKVPSKYEFVKGGLNFTLKESGYITAILGAFYKNSGKESMFDLYEVERTNGKISSLVRINNVYMDDTTKEISYDPTDTSGKTKVFSFDNLTKSDVLEHGCAYYFEIPVLAGDYVIGCSTTSSDNNAYLMYLDIGSNGGGTSTGTTKKYNIDSVDFVNSTTVMVSSDGKYQSYADIVAAISNLQDATQGVVIVFKRDGTTTSYSETKVTDKLLYYYDRTLVTVEFVVSDGTGVVQKTTADEVLNP